jgi:hypothetical protein
MATIYHILDSFRNMHLEDEDGEALEFSLEPALSEAELVVHEQATGMRFPLEFRDLLMYANGMNLFGLELMSTDQQTYFSEQGIMSFHNWGNGDFDCISISISSHPVGCVVFMNHTPDVTVRIATCLSEWLERAVQEIRSKGALLHPADYLNSPEQGLYQHVLESLRGVDCELNR